MRVLLGIPVFKLATTTARCLNSLVSQGADILIIDNNADPDVKAVISAFSDRAKVIVNEANEFCNKAWVQIMEYGVDNNYDLIGLGSSDITMPPGWYAPLIARAKRGLKEVLLPSVGVHLVADDAIDNIEDVTGSVAGVISFLPLEATKLVYPIPETLRMWFGDQWNFELLKVLGWKITIMHNIKIHHEQSAVTAVTPGVYQVIEEDKLAWVELKDELQRRINLGRSANE